MSLLIRLSILTAIIFVVEFYFIKKVLSTIKNIFPWFYQNKLKKFIRYIILFINLFLITGIGYMIYYAATGDRPSFPPENFLFDVLIQFPFWIFVLWTIQSVIFFLPIDILRILFFPLYKPNREKVKRVVLKVQLVIVFFFLIYVPARSLYDYLTVSIRVVEFTKHGLPKALDGLKITLIADIQADRYTNNFRLERFINKVNETRPDLVLIAGDVITSTPEYIDDAATFLSKIKSKHGIYSCVGDHDNWAYRNDTEKSLREISSALAEKRIKMLNNRKKILSIDSAKIGVTFVTNTYVESINHNLLDTLTNGDNEVDLKIFLTHQPRQFVIDKAIKKNYDLFLAGHTHGGQLTFLFPFYNLSPTLFETKYVRGDFHFGDMLAIVTRGLGMSLVPLRLNSTPEVTVIVLQTK